MRCGRRDGDASMSIRGVALGDRRAVLDGHAMSAHTLEAAQAAGLSTASEREIGGLGLYEEKKIGRRKERKKERSR